jgi:SAM-dependent methyltransferase
VKSKLMIPSKNRVAARNETREVDAMGSRERDYVLGTHDEEVERLGLQHDVWRPRAGAAWKRAKFAAGQTLIDIGAGPGYATLDLAELVGPTGRVIAVDRSRRFLDVLERRVEERGYKNVTVIESDLDQVEFEPNVADGAWCRWVLAFVLHPRELLTHVATAIKPGGRFVSHEYFDYASWRSMPPSKELEDFVQLVINNWRNSGGEPDIGLSVPPWLEELGFEVESITPIVDAITPADRTWKWPTSFMGVGLRRLVELSVVDHSRSLAIENALKEIAESPTGRMITPGVLEVVARRK